MPRNDQEAPETPPCSVELDALQVIIEAYIAVEGREKGQQILSEVVHILALREETETVVEFLPPKQLAARAKLRRMTAAWYRKSLPVWIARLTAS